MEKSVEIVLIDTKDLEFEQNPIIKCIKSYIEYGNEDEDGSEIEEQADLGELFIAGSPSFSKEFFVAQYAYATMLQDVVKNKDTYYIDKFTNKVTSSGGAEYGDQQEVIIATNDPKLTVDYKGYEYGTARKVNALVYLPQLQQSFLKEYVDNFDKEWEVKYETVTHNKSVNGFAPMFTTNELKLNQDNTVNINVVE